jgi:ATP-dependent protease HslVU (ClpYQ) peptidase subunit
MTTIAVVKKNGRAAIAADTLTKWGTGKESAAYIANNDKIVRAGATFIGASGSATFKTIMRDYFTQPKVKARFDSTLHIFQTWQAFHVALKEQYFLVTTNDKDDSLESSRFDVLLANPSGIFGVGAHRTVQEYVKLRHRQRHRCCAGRDVRRLRRPATLGRRHRALRDSSSGRVRRRDGAAGHVAFRKIETTLTAGELACHLSTSFPKSITSKSGTRLTSATRRLPTASTSRAPTRAWKSRMRASRRF